MLARAALRCSRRIAGFVAVGALALGLAGGVSTAAFAQTTGVRAIALPPSALHVSAGYFSTCAAVSDRLVLTHARDTRVRIRSICSSLMPDAAGPRA